MRKSVSKGGDEGDGGNGLREIEGLDFMYIHT